MTHQRTTGLDAFAVSRSWSALVWAVDSLATMPSVAQQDEHVHPVTARVDIPLYDGQPENHDVW
jgi:hypothetical protein